MSPELWFGLFGCASAVFTAGWAVLAHFSNRRYQEELRTKKEEREAISKEVSDAVKAGQGMVKVNDEKIEAYQKYNTQQFKVIETTNISHDKRIRVLESQLVAKETVREMLDDRVSPLEASVDKLEHTVEKGFKSLEEKQALTDMNMVQVLSKVADTNAAVARMEGYLRAKAEGKPDD